MRLDKGWHKGSKKGEAVGSDKISLSSILSRKGTARVEFWIVWSINGLTAGKGRQNGQKSDRKTSARVAGKDGIKMDVSISIGDHRAGCVFTN